MFRRRSGLLGTVARTAVVAGTASALAGAVAGARHRWAKPAEKSPAQSEHVSSSDLLTQLQQLTQLKERGMLTEEEYAAAKAKLLGSASVGP